MTSARLDLIVEAVRYCQRVEKLGMPNACYTKALREPIYFFWELRASKKKIEAAKFCSVKALGLMFGKGLIVYDHAIPFRYIQEELLNLDIITEDSVGSVLTRFGFACILTKEEDGLLNKAGLGRKMPIDWNGKDPLARYKKLNIEVTKNPKYWVEHVGGGDVTR